MERLAIGDMIKIVADDPESEGDISMWAKRNGHELLSVDKNNKDLEFLIKKAK
jgi:TusA-related sulfurtransferase